MSLEIDVRWATANIPDFGKSGSVIAAVDDGSTTHPGGDETRPVRAERDAGCLISLRQLDERRARAGIPNPRGLVAAAGEKAGPIGVPGHHLHSAGVPL